MNDILEQGGIAGQVGEANAENKELDDLKKANEKLKYQITHLKRALDENENKIEKNESSGQEEKKQDVSGQETPKTQSSAGQKKNKKKK